MNAFLKGIIIIVFLLLGLQIRAENPFLNQREEKSHYLGVIAQWQVNRLQTLIFLDEIFPILKIALEVEAAPAKACEYTILQQLEQGFRGISEKSFRKYGKHLLYLAREKDVLDDTSLRLLKQAQRYRERSKKYSIPESAAVDVALLPELSRVYSSWSEMDQAGTCLLDSWSYLLEELDKAGISLSKRKMKKYNRAAVVKGVINSRQFQLLELARRRDIHERKLDLAQYQSKLQVVKAHLKDQLGEDLKLGKSKFLSSLPDKGNLSYREYLYQTYTGEQIVAIGELMRRYWSTRQKVKSRKAQQAVDKSFFHQAGALAAKDELKPIQMRDVDFVAAGLELAVVKREQEEQFKQRVLQIFARYQRY